MRIKTNYLVSKFILLTFIPLIIPILLFLSVYLFKIIQFDSFLEIIITSFAVIIALYTFFANQKDLHNNKIIEQIFLMDGLIAELNSVQGNIEWYEKEINSDAFLKLNHPINKIHIENYLSRLNGRFFNKMGFSIISNIGDKIYQLNSHVSESRGLYLNFTEKNVPLQKRFNKKYCLLII